MFSSTHRSDIYKRPWIFVFCKNMGKNIAKNISKNLSAKYSKKLFDMLNNLQEMHLKLVQKK